MYAQIFERSPMRVFEESLHGGLAAGELGAVVGRAGTGKSALLVHLALDRLLRDQKVLHLSLRDNAEHVRSFYGAIFDGVAKAARVKGKAKAEARLAVEQNRQILCYLDSDFGYDDFVRAMATADEVLGFVPSVVLIDGLAPTSEDELGKLKSLAAEKGFALWTSLRSHREQPGVVPFAGAWSTTVMLEPVDTVVELTASRVHGTDLNDKMGLQLDPTTMLVTGEDGWDPMSAPPSPRAIDCTLYSGGATGSEAAFGKLAEQFGLSELNFTFDGHRQERTVGSKLLSDRELAAGDVSLVYVSKRLHRTYSEGSLIRRVLQSLWHQVSRAQQVFVVGSINSDGTVTGGTGWSVELARMWHKDLWVYDQVQTSWFHWHKDRWVAGVPVIESPHFCGTGTRQLNENGQRAIAGLFERSFGTPR
ncbi:MAG: hypothetical protein GY913_11270 [Proteobacteria bacterium]|nr:hypothetical protein [Pseudomonadota bacterium]MCP4917494.1 hypothetical protein [Pseudomonadota bacterium]